MSFLDIFRPLKKSSIKRWKELGTYKATFSVFGEDIAAVDNTSAPLSAGEELILTLDKKEDEAHEEK